ncbi:transcriptional regulator [Massilia glaciei]|uniref:Transcriptional regulator n=1 Tax=Massilia glaciei TaxID=1524097 RepID=A0A2U2HGE1_9BURK|nr:transcriptional regulator [Massilia glaciei]PWF44007.1 transcriptional regulator [Massilia glaciei]
MPSPDEKSAFSLRLKQALKRSPKKIDTATELALNFNLRHPSGPITTQAAQKWITGQSLPTIDKIATLAEWLNVSLQWLRFGIAEERPTATKHSRTRRATTAASTPPPTADELALLEKLRAMPEYRRDLVVEIVEQFAIEQMMWRG